MIHHEQALTTAELVSRGMAMGGRPYDFSDEEAWALNVITMVFIENPDVYEYFHGLMTLCRNGDVAPNDKGVMSPL